MSNLHLKVILLRKTDVLKNFNYVNFEKNYDNLNKESILLLNKNINSTKNKTDSKMENSKHIFVRKTKLASAQASQIKNKTVLSWSLQMKKECIFYKIYRVRINFSKLYRENYL